MTFQSTLFVASMVAAPRTMRTWWIERRSKVGSKSNLSSDDASMPEGDSTRAARRM